MGEQRQRWNIGQIIRINEFLALIKKAEEGTVKIKGRRFRKGKYTRKMGGGGGMRRGGGVNEGQGKQGRILGTRWG
jgi:hypothetical protein